MMGKLCKIRMSYQKSIEGTFSHLLIKEDDMNKKMIIAGLTCTFILISGVCYSCNFKGNQGRSVYETSLSDNKTTLKPTEITNDDANSAKNLPKDETTKDSESISSSEQGSINLEIYVHICGAVQKPGVYSIQNGARISDLIKLAGGLRNDAAGDYMNQAKKVSDGQRIYVPTIDEMADLSINQIIDGEQTSESDKPQDSSQQTESNSDRININTADEQALMTIPGIGEAKATSIIDYRTQNGNFAKPEDIMKISGIKEGLFRKIEPYIIVK
jgi:DNA uptake protein and related DNA-binding proteins